MKTLFLNNFAKMTLVSFFGLCLIFSPLVTKGEDTGFLWLVNRENPLCEKFRPSDLVKYRGIEIRKPARDAFVEMISAMEAGGIHGLRLQSAYRSFSHQRSIFEQKKLGLIAKGESPDAAEAIAAKSIQPPGASEHQLGLALDVSKNGRLSQAFAETDAGIWIAENCHRFGFIVRYPQAKTEVTDIIYEPWHLRFVGVPHAQIMKETALTLEEYAAFLSKIHMYVVWEDDGYFLVSLAKFPPESNEFSGEFSATKFGENSAFIVTHRK